MMIRLSYRTIPPTCATGVLTLLLAFAATAAAQPRGGPNRPAELKRYEGRYYVLHTDLDPDSAREADIRMTRMAEEYHARTKDFARDITAKFPFYLFKYERDYHRAGGLVGSAGGFNPNTGTLMAVSGEQLTLQTWHTVQHEGFHQFAIAVIGGDLPIWANEGLAEYFGESVFTGDGFVTGVIPQWRLKRVRASIGDGKFRPMPQVMLMSHEQWNAGLSVANYDQAWSMVHFLVHGDNGAYQRKFAAFIRDVGNSRTSWEQAWLDNIGPADGFERKWKTYWTKLPDDPTADLFAEAVVRTLTSYLARAWATGQRFDTIDAFLAEAEAGTLKSSDADWLPRSLLADALTQAGDMREKAGGTFSLVTIKPRPAAIVYQPKAGPKMTGRFTLDKERVKTVTVDRTRR